MKIGFDNEKYLNTQSSHIRERIGKFDNKLYLEFGGKLFDDYHASRVLPGFQPDSKLRMLKQLSDQAEVIIVISAEDIEKNKIRGDLGITYDSDVMRLISVYREHGLFVGSVVITKYAGQESASLFRNRLKKLGIKVYRHYVIPGYPANVPLIVSDEGYGKMNTSRPLDHWWLSLPRDLEAEKWPSASLSCIMSTNGASAPAMPNLRPSLSGISH